MKKKLLYSVGAATLAALVWMGATPSGTEIRRGGSTLPTTNQAGLYLTTDGTNAYWSIVSATSTNPLPAYVVTNDHVVDLNFAADLRVAGLFTNVGQAIFLDNVTILGTPNGLFVSGNINSGALRATNFVRNFGWEVVDGPSTNGFLVVSNGFINQAWSITLGAATNSSLRVSNWVNNLGTWTNAGNVNFAGLTGPNALVIDADENLTIPTGTPDGTKYLRDDLTWSVPPGGSATPGGTEGTVQINIGNVFYGSNGTSQAFVYDRTNNRVGVGLAGRFPRKRLEIAGGINDGILVGAGGVTNRYGQDGVVKESGDDLKLRVGGDTAGWYVQDVTGNLIPTVTGNGESIGVPGNEVSVLHSLIVSNAHFIIPSNSGTMTIYGTNQVYEAFITGNITIADSGLLRNVKYTVKGTNSTGIITWPAAWKWKDGEVLTSAPSLQNQKFEFVVAIEESGTQTNAYVSVGRTFLEAPDSVYLVYITNSTTGVVTKQLTNFTGSGALVRSNAPVVRDIRLINPHSENGIGYTNQVITGVGGANTNFTGLATDGVVYLDGGTTNINFLAIMPGVAGETYFPTYIISNLTTTARTVTLNNATTNFWRNLQQYDGITSPLTITNKHTGILAVMITGSNTFWSWKQSTNGF